MHPDRLFLPAVDCHTGDIPNLDSVVDVDHVIAVGSHRMTGGHRVHYSNPVPTEVAKYLRPSLIGQRFAGAMPNGDFVCQLEDVWSGTLNAARSKPVAA